MKKIKKFIWKHRTIRKDVIRMIYDLADRYDDRAEVNIAKCEECDKHKQVYAYFFAEGKTYRTTAKDLRDIAETLKLM